MISLAIIIIDEYCNMLLKRINFLRECNIFRNFVFLVLEQNLIERFEMKKIFTLALSLLFIYGGDKLSAQKNNETRYPGPFSKIVATGNVRVELYPSDSSYISIEVEGTTLDNLITETNDEGEYAIRLKTNTPREAKVLAKLYFQQLEALTAENQALITGNKIVALDDADFIARSGGKIELEINIKNLTAEAKKGGVMVLSGSVEKQQVEVTTGGTYSAYKLEARDSYVKSSTGGIAKVVSRRIMDATANAKGFIGYVGNPVSTYTKSNLGGEIDNFKEIPQ